MRTYLLIVPLILLSCQDVKETNLGKDFYFEQSDEHTSSIRYKQHKIVSLVNDYRNADSFILIKSHYLNTENGQVSGDSFEYYILLKKDFEFSGVNTQNTNLIGPLAYASFLYKARQLQIPLTYCDQLKQWPGFKSKNFLKRSESHYQNPLPMKKFILNHSHITIKT